MGYSYNRTAAGASSLFQILAGMAPSLEKELTAKAQRYTGESSHTRAKITPKADRLEVRVWLELGEGSTGDEARELAVILLGQGAKVGQHKLVSTMWVAVAWVSNTTR